MVRTTWLGMLPPNQRTSPNAPAMATQASAPSTMLRRRTASPTSQAAQASMATAPEMSEAHARDERLIERNAEGGDDLEGGERDGDPEQEPAGEPSPKLSGRPCSGFTDSAGASIWASSEVFTPWLMARASPR